MKPPAGTEWWNWDVSCPKCGAGFSASYGLEFDRIVRSHECPNREPESESAA